MRIAYLRPAYIDVSVYVISAQKKTNGNQQGR